MNSGASKQTNRYTDTASAHSLNSQKDRPPPTPIPNAKTHAAQKHHNHYFPPRKNSRTQQILNTHPTPRLRASPISIKHQQRRRSLLIQIPLRRQRRTRQRTTAHAPVTISLGSQRRRCSRRSAEAVMTMVVC